MEAKIMNRGIPLNQQRLWCLFVARENKLRLNWFKRNEARLNQIVEQENVRKVPSDLLQTKDENVVKGFQGVKRHALVAPEIRLLEYDEDCIKNVMRPVDKEVNNLIYASTQNDGRVTYLKERALLIPELRYYFPETSSFEYGWKMWDASKKMDSSRFGKQKVIQTSFYRRRGVDKDPEWYKEPAKLSPNTCGCI